MHCAFVKTVTAVSAYEINENCGFQVELNRITSFAFSIQFGVDYDKNDGRFGETSLIMA